MNSSANERTPDALQDLFHSSLGRIGETFACIVIAIFSGVGDGVTHLLHATFVHKVNDELDLMEALEVCHLRRITCLNERL